MKYQLGIASKIGIVLLILGVGYYFAPASWFSKKKTADSTTTKSGVTASDESSNLSSDEKEEVITISVPTWGGYAGAQYFNKGFKANKESRFYTEYGILVEFKLIDDIKDSRDAWKSKDVDLLWATADAFTTEAGGLSEFKPQIFFQCDWSRGGDAIVVRQGIKTVSDLKGKKIAVAPMSPSHTFLLNLFEAGEVSMKDVTIVQVANAIDAADLFKKGEVDAAVCWSPDDADCVAKVPGSKVLMNTKTASNIIADVFVIRQDYLDNNKKKLSKLVEGWLKGNAELNASADKRNDAAKILADGLNQPVDFCLTAINNARLCTYGDNLNFFDVTGKFNGVTGEDLYSNMSKLYAAAGYIKKNVLWRNVGNADIINMVDLSGDKDQAAEDNFKFTEATDNMKKEEAISSKKVSISFATGQWELDDNTKYIIDHEFANIAKVFSNSRIRVEGNTDNTGNTTQNRKLSEKRAQSVAEYLHNTYGFDMNRLMVVGNGPDKPVANNNDEEGRRKNRRTDFELLPN